MSSLLTNNIKNDLKDYMNMYGDLDNYELYRGVDYTTDDVIVNFTTLSSWSLGATFTERFGPNIFHTNVTKYDVLIDTTLFLENEIVNILGGFPDEQEVILLKGNYKIKFL